MSYKHELNSFCANEDWTDGCRWYRELDEIGLDAAWELDARAAESAALKAEVGHIKRVEKSLRVQRVTAQREAYDLRRKVAEQGVEIEALREALLLTGRRCSDVHHAPCDRHKISDPCPVEAKITKALEAGR